MITGCLVLRLTMLKNCLKRECSLHLASLVALILVMKYNKVINEDMIRYLADTAKSAIGN